MHTDCPLSWHGITLYGTYDVGVGWVSHGMPESPYNYEGESLVNRNGNHPQWLIAPNNLSQSGLGLRGKIEFAQDWFVVFNASTGINPQSGSGRHWVIVALVAALNGIAIEGLPSRNLRRCAHGARGCKALARPTLEGDCRCCDVLCTAMVVFRETGNPQGCPFVCFSSGGASATSRSALRSAAFSSFFLCFSSLRARAILCRSARSRR